MKLLTANWLGVAAVAWTLCGPVVGVPLASSGQAISWVACPLCDTTGFCSHRVWVMAVVHVLGVIGLHVAWARLWRHEHAGEAPAWNPGLGGVAFAALVLALLLEWTVSVETVMATGPLLACVGCTLLNPRWHGLLRAAGATVLAVSLAGFYTVVCFQLSPDQSKLPLLVAGLVGLGGVLVCGLLAYARTLTPPSTETSNPPRA